MKIKAMNNRYYGDSGWESDNDHFSEVAITWRQWLGCAKEHIYAANLLLPVIVEQHDEIMDLMGQQRSIALAPRVNRIYFFHCAIAIENSLKGLIAVNHREEIRSKIAESTKVPKILIGHDLVELASRVSFKIDLDSEYALAFLTRYGVWGGKYPFATKNHNNALTVRLSDGNYYMVGGHNPEVEPSFLSFASDIYSWAHSQIEASEASASGEKVNK